MSTHRLDDVTGMASMFCTICGGTGLRNEDSACSCTYRSIFRAIYARFREAVATGYQRSPVSMEGASSRPQGRRITSFFRQSDFISDCQIIARRTLVNPVEWDIFRFHFLLGADWKLCCKRLNIRDKGTYFHAVRRIEAEVGRAYAETVPWGLWPLSLYFSRVAPGTRVKPCPVSEPAVRVNGVAALRPPLCAKPKPAPAPQATPERMATLRELAAAARAAAAAARAVPSFDVQDPAAALHQIREWHRAGRSPRVIAEQLNRWNVPCQGAARWSGYGVRMALIASVERAA